MEQPFAVLVKQDLTRMRLAAGKLTHVGTQSGPVLSIVMSTFYYLPTLELFQQFQHSHVSHINDTLPTVGTFSVAPEEFQRLVAAAHLVCSNARLERESPSLSITIVLDTPEGRIGEGFVLAQEDGVVLHQSLASALDPSNGIGQTVLRFQRDTAYGGPT
jgi:hypothetical protein